VGRRRAAPPAPGNGAKTKKRRYLIRHGANEVSDVFVVGGATAVGYLWGLLSQICANEGDRGEASSRASLAPTGQSHFRIDEYPVGARLAREEAIEGNAVLQPNNSLMAMICSAT
jgi:hypothetical protein